MFQRLVEENHKRTPNSNLIKTGMNLTFFDRRQEILQNGASVGEVLEKYPCLVGCQVGPPMTFVLQSFL